MTLTINSKDQRAWDLQGTAHIMSFMDSFNNQGVSYFHWTYTNMFGNGKCWARGHAQDTSSHPCSTSHIRKSKIFYSDKYPNLYPSDWPPEDSIIQCDLSEHMYVHVNDAKVLNYKNYMDTSNRLCAEVKISLENYRNDYASSTA